MYIRSIFRVIHRVVRTDDAGHRFCDAAVEKCVVVIFKKAVRFHDLVRDNDIGRRSSDIPIRIARRIQRALVVHCRLNGKFLSRLEFMLPFGTDLDDFAAELMPNDDGVPVDILRNSLVIRALFHRFICRHTDAVRYDMRQNFILLHLR